MPASLEEALAALEQDHVFLLTGEVFTEDLLDAIRLRPHPYEFHLYFDL